VEEVITRAARGDRDALAELWRSHQHLLLRYLRGRRAAAPEDVASQVWIEVARGLAAFDGDAVDFRRWLFTIARRRHVDELRRAARRVSEAELDVDPADPTTPDEVVGALDGLEQAIALVRRLPDDMADAVLLRVVADLSVAEVAAIMGRSEGNVRVLMHRGLERLRSRAPVTRPTAATMNTVT
jgi:RNA polymerase sigma-70 factor (ECF subfamily)